MINKRLTLIIITLLIFSGMMIALTACETEEEPETPEEEVDTQVESIVKASGPTGSGWYPFSITMTDIWMDEIEGLTCSVLEGAGRANLETVNRGEDAEVGFTFAFEFVQAVEGEGEFEEPFENVKALFNMYPVYFNVAVLEDSDLESIEDLEGARISPGEPGHSSEVVTRIMLEEGYGISYEDIEEAGGEIAYGDYSDAAMMLRDGTVDAAMGLGAPEVTAFAEVDAMSPIRLLEPDEEVLQQIEQEGLGLMTDPPIPAGTYSSQEEDTSTFVVTPVAFVNKELPEDFVYEITKQFWENIDTVREEHPARGEGVKIENAVEGIDLEHFHEGALRYFEEEGLIE